MIKRIRESLILKWMVFSILLATIPLIIVGFGIVQIYHEDLRRSLITVEGIALAVGILLSLLLTRKLILPIKRLSKEMEEELVQRTRELEALNEMGTLINQTLVDPDTIFPIALEKAMSLTGFEMGSIFMLNEERNILERKFHKGFPPKMLEDGEVLKYGEGVSGRAVILKQPIINSINEYSSFRVSPVLIEGGIQTLVGFPLLAKGKAIGTITLFSRSPHDFTQREVNLLESIGNQIGLALENAKLFTDVAKAKSEWETTFDAVTDLITIRDKDYRILRANKAAFKRFGLEPEEMIGKRCFETLHQSNQPCEGCYVSKTLETKKPESGERDSKYLKGIFQYYTFPIYDEAGEVIAVVDLAREITEEKRLEIEKEVVNNVNKILASGLDMKQVIQAVHSELKRVLDSERMSVAVFNEEGEGFRYLTLDYNAKELLEGVIYPKKGTPFEKAIETGLPVIVSDTAESDSWIDQKVVKEGILSVLVFPLEYKGRIIGAMNFGSKESNHFSDHHIRFLHSIASELTISIENALLLDAIKESEEKYRTVVEGALDGVLVVGDGYQIKYVNERLAEIVGYPREELIGMDFRNYLDDESRQLVIDRYVRRQKGEEVPPRYEFNVVQKNREIRNVEISSTIVKDSQGNVNTIAILKDITERKRAEEALQRSEETATRLAQENAIMAEIGRIISSTLNIEEVYERFAEEARKLIPFDRITISLTDLENNTSTTAYLAGIGVLGRGPADIIPMAGTVAEEVTRTRSSLLIQGDNINEVASRFPALLPTFQAGLRSMIFVPLMSKDQVIGVLSLRSLVPKAYTDQDVRLAESIGNQIAGAIANAQLFIEHQRTEEALRVSEDRYRDLVEHSQDMICIHDLEGWIISINQAATKLLGYEQNELLKINFKDILAPAPEVRDQFEMYMTELKRDGFSKGLMLVQTKKGETRIWEYNSSLRTEGISTPVVRGMAHDITDRKRTEEEREKLILQLQKALAEVKQLSGLLPICASCKKIRDDKGYWNQIESYIRDHSEAEFSHGICPECMKKLYPGFDESVKQS